MALKRLNTEVRIFDNYNGNSPKKRSNLLGIILFLVLLLGFAEVSLIYYNSPSNADNLSINVLNNEISDSLYPNTEANTYTSKVIDEALPSGEGYETNPKKVYLDGIGSYVVYEGVNDYLAGLNRWLYSPATTKDFILKDLNDEVQKEYLEDLVDKIKAKSNDASEQARIIIDMVQEIPYDYTAYETGNVDGRYPYEVLYDMKGVCMEKSDLIAYLLREIGFGVAIFEFHEENHRAVGIKCSDGNYNSEYCFIESTVPTPIGYIPESYVGDIDLRDSNPEVVVISDGLSYR